MDEQAELFESLRQILRQIRDPQSLNDHPWTSSLIVREALEEDPQLREACPGQQLIAAIVRLFSQLRPPAPPRRGKRLDPRWGEFGLLAALYFTPFNHGTPYPNTMMDAQPSPRCCKTSLQRNRRFQSGQLVGLNTREKG